MTGLDEFHPETTTKPQKPTTTTPTDEQFNLAVALVRAEGEIVRLTEKVADAWDEGYHADNPHHPPINPYRTPHQEPTQ